jgi:hypothetical protein
MHYRLAVEDIAPNHWIAWALDLPACYSPAQTADEAISLAPGRIGEYFSWIKRRDPLLPIPPETIDVEVVETFRSRPSRTDPEYLVNAFFEDDRRPLGYWEAVAIRRLLDWTRQDLQKVISALDDPRQQKEIPGEMRGVILGILRHVAEAENEYVGRMGLGLKPGSLPDDPLLRIALVRKNTNERLWSLMEEVRFPEDHEEFWSARKVLRRALWHERDHTQHIQHLLAGIRTKPLR